MVLFTCGGALSPLSRAASKTDPRRQQRRAHDRRSPRIGMALTTLYSGPMQSNRALR